ncbi:MAG TPA: hypothetical protein DEA96_06900 [Leptospiraceae bacterium]|nr:hypothetical protein [Spirochaetaceae bacterium]HBS04672.1 hypothetical protein [Leptospiraceae bacterium]|tara:strand:+ start:8300 stop:9406 length:1107 start_codon:yes stop_codon:yes gene_type:complete
MFFDDAFSLFLQSIGRSEEIDFYLKKFRQSGSDLFALIVPDAESVSQAPEMLRTHLYFLSRLGLFPAVLLTEPVASGQIHHFQDDRTFRIETWKKEEANFSLTAPEDHRTLRVIHSERGLLDTLHRLVPSQCKRIHFVRLAGAIRTNSGESLFHCNPEANVRWEDGAILNLCRELLSNDSGIHLSVTTPFDLLKEIFTVKGAGTIVRERSEINLFHSMNGVDRQRLVALLQESFGRRLNDESILDRMIEMHIDSRYRGAVLLEDYQGMRYLSKFAVGLQARGEGVAQELWDSVLAQPGPLFWRSRRKNTIHRWYERLADGFHRLDYWTVYWKNTSSNRIPELIEYASNRPEDFSDFSLPAEGEIENDH